MTLADLWAAIGGPRVYEGFLKDDKGKHLHGLCDYERDAIFVNVKYSVVDSVVHELLHRKFPRRSERRIQQDTDAILASMTPADIAWWYRRFQVIKRPSRLVELEK